MLRRFLLALPFALLSACQRSEPAIGKSLPSEYAAANEIFNQRIKKRFPPGTSEAFLIQTLEAQGFKVEGRAGNGEAKFTHSYILFETVWSVRWKASGLKVQEIFGVIYGHGL